MTSISLHGNNKLIRKTILKVFPASFAANLTTSIALVISSLLAGALLGPQAIAAVAIGQPVVGIFQALTQTIVSGAAVKLSVAAGRGDHEKSNGYYSLGFVATVVLGLVFIAICQLLANGLVMAFGGAGNAVVAKQAAYYLRAVSVCILMGSLNTYTAKVMALYGHQKAVFRSALIALVGNVIFSTLYVRLLPDHLDIVGLGIGMWTGGTLAFLTSMLTVVCKKVPLRFGRKSICLRDLPEMFRLGIPTSGNNLADGVVSGVINNIIVSGFGGDTMALSIYTAVKGVVSFGIAAITAATSAVAPLFGVLYGARDKKAIIRATRESLIIGMVASILWCGLLVACLPLLERFYSMTGQAQFRPGVVVCMLFIPLLVCIRVMTQLFESTEKTAMGLLYSIVPDSVIYPVMLALLLPVMGYYGIWISFSANAIPFLIVLYLVRSLKNKTLRMSPERLLCLDESIRDYVPAMDISIRTSNADVTGISTQIHQFLLEQDVSKRTAYMTALCLEELAADLVEHTMKEGVKNAEKMIMDIKLFSDEDAMRIIMRNAASAYNPLDFDLNEETFSKVGVKLAQKVARKIGYQYVYRMNVITIEMAK